MTSAIISIAVLAGVVIYQTYTIHRLTEAVRAISDNAARTTRQLAAQVQAPELAIPLNAEVEPGRVVYTDEQSEWEWDQQQKGYRDGEKATT